MRVAPSSGCAHSPPAGTAGNSTPQNLALHAGSIAGTYQLSTPRPHRATHPASLILLFYGFGSNPSQFSTLTGLPHRGSLKGYLVAAPNIQSGETEWQFSGTGSDAVFVNALVAHLEQTYCVNQNAVFATGFSAGAAFTIAYSCAHEGQVHAIATVAVEFQLGCKEPMSILAFHGTADPLVPYQNGAIGLSLPGVKVRGTQLNMADWAKLDRCRAAARVSRIGSQVTRSVWSGCQPGSAVTLYSVLGGGHTWPGADPKLGVGLTTEQVSATTQMLAFFDRRR